MLKRILTVVLGVLLIVGALELLGLMASQTPSYEECYRSEYAKAGAYAENQTQKWFWKAHVKCTAVSLDQNNGFITALATLFLAGITGWLVWVAREQSKTTQVQLRAFVHAIALNSRYELDKTSGHHNWRLQPTWMNSGDTPTRHLRIYTGCEVTDSRLPAGFDFRQLTGTIGNGLLGPKIQLQGGQAPQLPAAALTPQILDDARNGKKFIYLWGWARYNDTFPGTAEHLTRFCWYIFVNGDPFGFIPEAKPGEPGSVRFTYAHHSEGNCADDECAY